MTGVQQIPARAKVTSPPGAIVGFVRHRPLTSFLVLAFGLGWPLAALPVLASHDLLPGGDWLAASPIGADQIVVLASLWLAMVPAALIVTAITDGRAAIGALGRRALRWRFGVGWWLAVLVGLPTIAVLVQVALGGTFHGTDIGTALVTQLVSVASAVVIVNLAEETVWAGFLQTRLEQRHGIIEAALLTAVPFAAIHLPLQLLGDPTPTSFVVNTGFLLVFGVAVRLMMGVFRHAARDSLLALAALHAVSNATNSSDGLVATLVPGNQPILGWLVAAIVLTAAAAAVIRPARRIASGVARS